MPRKTATWPKTSIHTAPALAHKARRLDRRNHSVEGVLAAMRQGASLHLSFSPRPHWRLSTGTWLTDEMARTLINLPNATAVGDALFAGELSQTFRYTSEDQESTRE
jgi:hypothetical protein